MLKSTLARIAALIALSTSPAVAQSPREVAEKVMPSVVLLVMEDQDGHAVALGSGFVVGEGLIATNYHVVEGVARGFVRLVGKADHFDVRAVVNADQRADLVVLSVDGLSAAALPIGDSSTVAIGDEVFVVSNPKGLEGTFSAGIVSAIRQTDEEHLIQITAPISSGSSGAPVLNANGEVIGVASATVKEGQNLNFAIPASYLLALLSKPHVVPPLNQQLRWLGDQAATEDPVDVELEASFESIHGAAEEGDTDAMHKLGECYFAGRGVIQNHFEAAKWESKAADGGHTGAMQSLAMMYGLGSGVPKDTQQMLAWLRKAADLGDGSAYGMLAWVFDMGWFDVSPDATEAAHWYRKAAENGAMDAMRPLGLMYLQGRGVTRDELEGARWLRMAAEKYREAVEAGGTALILELADMYDLGHGVAHDDKEAAKWVRKAAELGQVDHMYAKGNSYEIGFMCPRNSRQAARWYRRAAEFGHVKAMSRLASMYANGRGVPKDDREAVLWYRRAGEQGSERAMFNLGIMYSEGRGVPKDDREAVLWYRRAAERGLGTAMVNLGVMYSGGRGIQQDDREAVMWWRRAAEQGNSNAMVKLGVMYSVGRGVPQDEAEAYVWLSLAVSFGEKEGIELRDSYADSLTLEARLAAQERSRELFQQISERAKH